MKIFCIGQNKTGTTSLAKTLKEHKFNVASQHKGELLCKDWMAGNFQSIVEFAKTADAFQDRPFYMGDTYKYLDVNFPNAKFILSVRDSPDQWYDSFIRYQSKMFGAGKKPTVRQLKRAGYCYTGWIYDVITSLYGTTEEDVYNKEKLVDYYIRYNTEVIEYFKDRPDDLLMINLKDDDSYIKLCEFLNIFPKMDRFPHLNKTK